MEHESSPEEIDQLRRQVERLKMEEFALAKETDDASVDRIATLRKDLADREEELRGLESRWEREKDQLQGEGELRRQLDQLKIEAEKKLRGGLGRSWREHQLEHRHRVAEAALVWTEGAISTAGDESDPLYQEEGDGGPDRWVPPPQHRGCPDVDQGADCHHAPRHVGDAKGLGARRE
jgi:ATP-dependent Clp protease ATP-binding subunit ClpA